MGVSFANLSLDEAIHTVSFFRATR